MGMSFAYGPADEEESLRVLRRYMELGGNFLDTAENLRALQPMKNCWAAFCATIPRNKRGHRYQVWFSHTSRRHSGALTARRKMFGAACDASLKRLGIENHRSLLSAPRRSESSNWRRTVGAMGRAHLGRKKCGRSGSPKRDQKTLRRAPPKFIPSQLCKANTRSGPANRKPTGVLAACREIGDHLCFLTAPLGRGFLTGAIQKLEDLDATDWRRTNPRFSEKKALQANLKTRGNRVKELASKKGASPAQLALAWVLAQGNDLIPIPGTKRVCYLEENMGALDVTLTETELKEISAPRPCTNRSDWRTIHT